MISTITAALTRAMKAQDKERMRVLRGLKAALMNRRIELKHDLTEAEGQEVLASEIKQREQAIELYKQGKRMDLVDNDLAEIAIIREFLPRQLSVAEMEQEVMAAFQDLAASSLSDMGRVMKHLKEKLGTSADGKTLSDIVRSKLSG
ncbi:MAG: GatB/YqeY domain-containing protein [Candidatus Cloacimonetes bacterium]|nr:GatB/YqeY domain-containing protein [Candidatus Cloacimonadota bacterium]